MRQQKTHPLHKSREKDAAIREFACKTFTLQGESMRKFECHGGKERKHRATQQRALTYQAAHLKGLKFDNFRNPYEKYQKKKSSTKVNISNFKPKCALMSRVLSFF